ncbi:MAG TPA: alpha/beta fold hydrolase [Chloroflexota bacterium]|nr:alpha/beta fold hydrolase [Chloroflexota bacterium]
MIDLKAPESTRSDDTPAVRLPAADRHVAGRARLTAADGLPLHYRTWNPVGRQTEASLLFLHGIASHGAWFAETAVHLADRGIAVYAPDRRGSGLSGGPRGHIASYEQALDDLDQFRTLATEEHAGAPVFLAGSSWAAKLAIASAARNQTDLAGLILLGPGLFPKVDLTVREKLAVLLYHRAQPQRELRIPLVPDDYTRNPAYLEYVRRDAYRLLMASSRFFWETGRLDRARDRLAASLSLPILLQIGEADQIMDARATSAWLQRLSAPDRTSIVYRGAAHTLDFEPEPTVRAYRADLLGWLRRQVRREPGHVR